MHLSQLLSGIACEVYGNSDLDIKHLTHSTQDVLPGSLFICIEGQNVDGHSLISKAQLDGAIAVVVTHKVETLLTQIIVQDTRESMSLLAKNFYNYACEKIKIICVVGTNGKTSTTYLANSIFQTAGYKTAIIGSNGIFIDGVHYDNPLTTPDSIMLHFYLDKMVKEDVKFVFMEATAHAIALKKLAGIRAEATIFTNFSQDHLDFFGSMKEYGEAKKSFFCPLYTKIAIVNADDNLGQEIIKEARTPTLTYGYTNPSDIFAMDYTEDQDGLSYILNLYDQVKTVKYHLHGLFNVYNTLCASALARIFGIKLEQIAQGINKVKQIDGRNQTFFDGKGSRIVVDFAHTPDGINNILTYLKSSSQGKLIVVFGCGGNRDRFKRPLMAKCVSKFADYIFVTNDNPRNEAPQTILQDIECGLSTTNYTLQLTRSQAITEAVAMACSGDTVAVLGKGAEKYQEIKGVKIPYSDIDVVQGLL
ncbi:MAG: UDP-N-acetylmuramoyl-L-alanyl-D-glutamate--2,6-diaminopimelate ligase [Clostridia bacterium]